MGNKLHSLGSVVKLNGGEYKAIIIARGVVVNTELGRKYFEYGACLYPHGFMGENILYFNNEDIEKILYQGFSDQDDEKMLISIDEWYKNNKFEKGSVKELISLKEKKNE